MLREFLTVEVLRILWVCCCSRNTVDDKNVALRTETMGIMVYSLLWRVMQDLYHQP